MRQCQGKVVWILVTAFVLISLFHIYTRNSVNDDILQAYIVPARYGNRETKETTGKTFILEGAAQDDPNLIDYIRREMLDPPSTHKYDLKRPLAKHYSQFGQSRHANDVYFHGMRDGFFIEVGAVDGEFLSNSLFFEKELGWRGLLIEPIPSSYENLLRKNRKAYSVNAALSTSTNATQVTFSTRGIQGTLGQIDKKGITVQALPLYSLLLALDVKFIDFFSLDIESYDVKILKTLPWDRVKFRLMCVEVINIPEGIEYLIEFLEEKGYQHLGTRDFDAWFGWPGLYNVTKQQ